MNSDLPGSDAALQQDYPRMREAYEWVEWAVFVVICVVLVFTFVVRTVWVEGESMEPTLYERDTMLATRLGAMHQGDIVALSKPSAVSKPLIKRIIATGGQTVDIDYESGAVYVDGQLLDEPYIAEPIEYDGGYLSFPQSVPEGSVFVLGDNRNHSMDSRAPNVGMVDERHILGKVIFRITPLDRIGFPG